MYYLSEFPTILLNESTPCVKKTKVTTKTNHTYTMIHYDKQLLSFDLLPTVGLLRSVVVNQHNQVVCFAPPKSYSYDSFIKKYPDMTRNNIVVEEFVEGVMINVFWDKSFGLMGAWEIATHYSVGGSQTIDPSGKTFRELFLEAVKENHVDMDLLEKSYCYSFVLQHPELSTVTLFRSMQLYLVEVYEITQTENQTVLVFPLNIHITECCASILRESKIKTPKIYHVSNYEEVKQLYASRNTPYHIMGVVMKHNKTGERCKCGNPVYNYVKQMQGPKFLVQYQYLTMRKAGKVPEFFKLYPEHKKDCSYFRDQLHLYTKTLHENYLRCYVKKDMSLSKFPIEYRSHMTKLHRMYVDEWKPISECVSIRHVMRYVNEMDSQLLMDSLTRCIKQRTIGWVDSSISRKYHYSMLL